MAVRLCWGDMPAHNRPVARDYGWRLAWSYSRPGAGPVPESGLESATVREGWRGRETDRETNKETENKTWAGAGAETGRARSRSDRETDRDRQIKDRDSRRETERAKSTLGN